MKNLIKINIHLDPDYVTGFCDGEACFFVNFQKSSERRTGWGVRAGFSIGLHEKDKRLLELIKSYFGVGEIFKHSKNASQYRVTSLKELTDVIIPHFLKHPLITQKRADFEFFKQVVCLMNQRKHVTTEGILQILNIKAAMNYGLSDALKAAPFFSNISPVTRPVIEFKGIPNPN